MLRQEGCRKNPSATLLPNHLGPVVSSLVLCTCSCRIVTVLLQLARSEPSRSEADMLFPCTKNFEQFPQRVHAASCAQQSFPLHVKDKG